MNLSDDLLEIYIRLVALRDELALRADYYSLERIKSIFEELAKIRIKIHEQE